MHNAIRWRIVGALTLLVAVLLFLTSEWAAREPGQRPIRKLPATRLLLNQVDAIVDTLLARTQIDSREVKTWSVFTPDKRFIRQERRVYVPPQFMSLDFNHDLSRRLSDFNARVIATERTKESTVSMHIISDGMVIETITFVLKRDLK